MDGHSSPRWAVGNPMPESFEAIFGSSESRARPSFSWGDLLAARKPETRQRAWCRVAVPAHPSSTRRGMIMKRVGHSMPRQSQIADGFSGAVEAPRPAVRRRLSSYNPVGGEVQVQSDAGSLAETSNAVMQAKVDVANCYLNQKYPELTDDLRLAKEVTYTKKTVPLKRRFTDYTPISFEYTSGGNRIATYNELNPILSKGAETGRREIDLHTASIADAGARLQNARPNPRIHLAASGVPDLSSIADTTEPQSILTLEPNESESDAKSPTKRDGLQSPSPTKANKGLLRRLSDSIIKLVPVSSPRAEPSPTKSSAPSTPFKESPSAFTTGNSATLPKSPTAAQSPVLKGSSKTSTPISARLKQRLSIDSPFSRWRPTCDSPAAESPVRYIRPVAPTPSKWNGPEPTTPYHIFTPAAASPNRNESPLGLVASLPASVQEQLSAVKLVVQSPINFDFGPSSPSFNSTSWLNSPVSATEAKRVKNIRRRKSEPLVRHLLKGQSRRTSLSPQKSVVEQTACISGISGLGIFTPTELANVSEEPNSENIKEAEVTMEESTAEPNYAQYVKTLRDTSTATPTPRNRLSNGSVRDPDHGIYDIDMRENPDIFGALAPTGTLNPDIEQLARIAETRCNDLANVVVTETNGRLFVRFKLPAAYASMFPESQGADASHFSTSPAGISSSPRIRFNAATSSEKTEGVQDVIEGPTPTFLRVEDRTIAVSDFGGSPVKKPLSLATSSPQNAKTDSSPATAINLFDDTGISFPDITLRPGDTTIPGIQSPSLGASFPRDMASPLSELDLAPSLEIPLANEAQLASTPIASTPAPAIASPSTEIEAPIHNTPASNPSTVIATPTLNVSFTPVNKNSAGKVSPPIPKQNPLPAASPAAVNAPSSARPTSLDDDSPGRQYMRDFIKRSRPKRLSTTETGSPVAPQRLPLGDKSPNMETPQKGKRKYESEGSENESEAKNKAQPAPKKVRRVTRPNPLKSVADVPLDEPDHLAMDDDAPVAEEDNPQDDDTEEAPIARRSSRLRTQTTTKSSIPAPIKVGRGRRGVAGLSSVRNEQQDLNYQTRMNTRRNKGDAEYPAQVLARSSEAEDDSADEPVQKNTRGKNVVWKEPLEAFQEAKPKRGRGALPKTKAKPESNRVSKPAPNVTTSTQRQKSARMAASLGMAGNGTPAKRVTRSSARSRK